MKCPECGQDNLDFKFYCGFCGAQLKDFSKDKEITDSGEKRATHKKSRLNPISVNRKIGNSRIFGLFFIFIPLLLILLILPIASFLAQIGDISALLFLIIGVCILLNLFMIAGIFIFFREWDLRTGMMEGPIRAVLAFMLCVSLLFVCIFGSINTYDSYVGYRYHEPIDLQFAQGVSIGNWKIDTGYDIGIVGSPGGAMIDNVLFYSSTDDSNLGIKLVGASNCFIEDCVFFFGMRLTDCHDIVISNCIFRASTIVLTDCYNIEVTSCTSSYSGFLIDNGGSSNIIDYNNEIVNIDLLPEYPYYQFPAYGLVVEGILIALSVIWLFYFGWLREIRPEDY